MITLNNLSINLFDINIVSVFFRLLLATICGGLIGLERGRQLRAAGFRTHILVCIGATLAMLTNQYIIQTLNVGGDPSRMGAQVISGIGFLGAGTIIVTGKQRIKGLTTAAGLWACASMGLAIGIGFYSGAILGCFFILFATKSLQKVDTLFYRSRKVHTLYIELSHLKYLKLLVSHCRSQEHKIYSTEFLNNKNAGEEKEAHFLITIALKNKKDINQLISEISELEGINFIQRL